MSARAAPVPADLVPRFVRSLNAIAERGGMAVHLEVGRSSGDSDLRLWSVWEGTRAQLASLGLFTPRQFAVLPIGAYRSRHAAFTSVPAGGYSLCPEASLLAGPMHFEGEHVAWHIDSGAWPCTIEQRGDVEVVTYADAATYWGSPEGLLALGIDRERLPLGKRGGRSHWGCLEQGQRWTARRHPDGTVRYHVETEDSVRRRNEEEARRRREWEGVDVFTAPPSEWPKESEAPRRRPGWLRLVVDNTRGGGA